MVFDSTVAIVPHLKAGKLRPLAISSAKRSALLPDVPTFAEAGMPGVESYAWYGLFVRAGTPKDIVARLNAEINAALKMPDVRTKLETAGIEVQGGTSQDYASLIKTDLAKWGRVVKEAGIPME